MGFHDPADLRDTSLVEVSGKHEEAPLTRIVRRQRGDARVAAAQVEAAPQRVQDRARWLFTFECRCQDSHRLPRTSCLSWVSVGPWGLGFALSTYA
jgi:hypothetical protein